MMKLSRRNLIVLGLSGVALPRAAAAVTPREIWWEDLIPPGVAYPEIIGEGELDEVNDTWNPIYDANASKLNASLDGAYIRMPGYVVPLETTPEGVIEFILVPYVGACIHTPPPPPNQLVLVRTADPWSSDSLWDPVWVEGRMRAQFLSTEIAETGYTLSADKMEIYKW